MKVVASNREKSVTRPYCGGEIIRLEGHDHGNLLCADGEACGAAIKYSIQGPLNRMFTKNLFT